MHKEVLHALFAIGNADEVFFKGMCAKHPDQLMNEFLRFDSTAAYLLHCASTNPELVLEVLNMGNAPTAGDEDELTHLVHPDGAWWKVEKGNVKYIRKALLDGVADAASELESDEGLHSDGGWRLAYARITGMLSEIGIDNWPKEVAAKVIANRPWDNFESFKREVSGRGVTLSDSDMFAMWKQMRSIISKHLPEILRDKE